MSVKIKAKSMKLYISSPVFTETRLSKHFLNPLDKLRNSSFQDRGKEIARKSAKVVLPDLSFVMMLSMLIRFITPLLCSS
jgi:hypothetical protein